MKLSLEQHIIHQLLLRSSLGKEVGLYHGKMGLILCFVHYFRHSGLKVYDDVAGELMDELKAEINTELPVGFASGLSGVGWGVEYLIQNGFAEGDDSLQVCKSIDEKIMEKDPHRIKDYSLDNGLEGILHYVLAHCKGVIAQRQQAPFDGAYLRNLYKAIISIPKEAELSESFKSLSNAFTAYYEKKTAPDYTFQLLSIIEVGKIEKDKLNSTLLGLKKGLAGYLLNEILTA